MIYFTGKGAVRWMVFTGGLLSALFFYCQNEQLSAKKNPRRDTAAEKNTINIDPMARIGGDMRELAIDLLNYHACRRLKDRIFALSQKQGASGGTGKTPSVGNFWIRSCSTTQIDSQHVQVAISGIGWRWLSRKKTQAGAEFELDENVKFQVDVSTTGTVDLAYDQKEKIATGYFVPTDSVDVTISVTGDLDIETEEIWSSIVGTAADVVGAAPEERAEQAIKKKGARQLKARLDHGMSVIVDLCTGQRYARFGTFPPGQIPQAAKTDEKINFQANSPAILYRNSLVMSGPYDTNNPLIAYVEVDSGNPVIARWVCSYNAEKIAEAYVGNDSIPGVEPIDKQIVSQGKPITMRADTGLKCPVVLMLEPAAQDTTPTHLLYRVYYEGDVRKPLAACQ